MKTAAQGERVRPPTHEEIATRAFQLFCERGGEPGHEVDDWLQAEYELMQLPIRTLADLYNRSMAQTSFALVMLAVAGTMALLLGIIGIYGGIAYAVWQYWRASGDDSFMLEAGAEILVETARFWASQSSVEWTVRPDSRRTSTP